MNLRFGSSTTCQIAKQIASLNEVSILVARLDLPRNGSKLFGSPSTIGPIFLLF